MIRVEEDGLGFLVVGLSYVVDCLGVSRPACQGDYGRRGEVVSAFSVRWNFAVEF